MTKTDAEALEKMAESNAYPHHDVWVYEAKALFRAIAAEKRAAVPVDAERGSFWHKIADERTMEILRLREEIAILRTPAEAPDDAMVDGFYLASFKRKAWDGCVTWWRPDNKGYTTDIERAGIYTLVEKGHHDSEYTVPVPVSFIASARVRRSIDRGDETNKAFRTAEDLRAALLAARQGEKK